MCGYEVGDLILVHKKPKHWSSLLSNKCPTNGDIHYPMTIRIDDVKQCPDYVAVLGGGLGWDMESLLEVSEKINPNNTKNTMPMSIIEKFQLATKSEPEKTFIEQGICNMNGSLTTDGQQLFIAWLLKSNGEAFKTEVVDVMVKNEEKA